MIMGMVMIMVMMISQRPYNRLPQPEHTTDDVAGGDDRSDDGGDDDDVED